MRVLPREKCSVGTPCAVGLWTVLRTACAHALRAPRGRFVFATLELERIVTENECMAVLEELLPLLLERFP